MCFAVIVSCMPSVRLFLLYFFPKLDKDPTRGGSSNLSRGGTNNLRGLHYKTSLSNPHKLNDSYGSDSMSAYELLEGEDHKMPVPRITAQD